MKTLVIHPYDSSTTFLEVVYKDIPEEDKTVVRGGITIDEVEELIKRHDRVMMMGHGSPNGLFSIGQFEGTARYGYVIDSHTVPLLAEKTDNVFIWCNADEFVMKNKLKGFYTGMFISEVSEAYYCGLPGTKQDLVDESNYGFVEIVGKHATENTETIHENVKNEYTLIAEENPVAYYNCRRLYKY